MCKILVTALAAFAALAGWAGPAGAGLLSTTGPVVALLADEVFVGEAEDNRNGSGTFVVHSRARPGLTCRGQFAHSAERGGAGSMRCSDGDYATFQYRRLGLARGYGTGSSNRGRMSLAYGLSAAESARYLKLPEGKALRSAGRDVPLADLRQAVPASLSRTGPVARAPEAAPDALLSAAISAVTAGLKQDKTTQTESRWQIAELVESTILPLLNLRHMAQRSVARDWLIASPDQQDALTAEFRTLLVRTYSTALSKYRDQAIEYRPMRIAPGETEVTVKSSVKQPGNERISIDYDMEKTTAGWKVYDIKIAGISLITTYRSTFAQTVRESGLDGLIESLAARNRQADAIPSSYESSAQQFVFMHAVIQGFFSVGR